VETIEKNGTVFVLVPEAAWNKLARGDVTMPELPPADAEGNRDALAYARVSIARTIIRDRIAAGLSQARLAELAGITRQVLNRIEHARVTPDGATVAKIDRAIKKTSRARRQGAHVLTRAKKT
jgi:ribosome-binding protein aMBF1 (putative translation factor)